MVLSERALRRVAAIPVLANILLYGLIAYATFAWAGPWLAGWLPGGEGWWRAALRGLMWLVLGILYLLTAVYTFVLAASVIAAPFNDLLAERTERIIRGEAADTPLNWKTLLAEARYTVRHEALKALVLLFCLLALFLINFIPVAGSVAYAVLNPLVTLAFLTLNFTDVIMSRRKLGLREKFRMILAHPMSSLSFGAAAFVALLVPGLNVLMLGGSVVGATQMYLEQWERPVPRPEGPPAHVA